jgi:antitoxin YobK
MTEQEITAGGGETRMDEVAALLAQMRELEPQVHVYGPAGEDAIRQLEAAFGRPLPPSYRAFLARFGGFSILDSSYSGIIDGKIEEGRGWAWTDTKYAREWCQLPEHYLVVPPDEDGFKCLDFSRTGPDGEHPVVYHMPFRVSPFAELAPSYGAWLTEDLQAMVEARAEDA